jgi:hypothetical protein
VLSDELDMPSQIRPLPLGVLRCRHAPRSVADQPMTLPIAGESAAHSAMGPDQGLDRDVARRRYLASKPSTEYSADSMVNCVR